MSLDWNAKNTPLLNPSRHPGVEIPEGLAGEGDETWSDYGWAILENGIFSTIVTGSRRGEITEEILKRIFLFWKVTGATPWVKMPAASDKHYATLAEARACLLGVTVNVMSVSVSKFLATLMENVEDSEE